MPTLHQEAGIKDPLVVQEAQVFLSPKKSYATIARQKLPEKEVFRDKGKGKINEVVEGGDKARSQGTDQVKHKFDKEAKIYIEKGRVLSNDYLYQALGHIPSPLVEDLK